MLSNDNNCCSAAENKHMPLIKHPSGQEESVCFLQLLFHPPVIYRQRAINPPGKTVQTKREMRGKHGKENSSKEGPLSSQEFFFHSTLSMTGQHNKLQGSVVLKQNRAVPLGPWDNRSDPILSLLSMGFILAFDAQMLRLFFRRNDCRHLLHISPFCGVFTS